MKKIQLIICFTGLLGISFAQNYYPSTGPVAFGTPTAPGNGSFNLQLHGVSTYTETNATIGTGTGNVTYENHGITSALSLTNSMTGSTNSDGALFRISESNVVLENLEDRDLSLKTGNTSFILSGLTNRLWVGGSPSTDPMQAKFNIRAPQDNGLFIQTSGTGKYGLCVRGSNENDNAIQVIGNGGSLNFSVQSKGEVYARKYITTLSNIPDYVFDSSYELMPLVDLKSYIETNKHLPNIPSANEYEETGVDLGEMNRLLLEKVEELTLYVLHLEDRMKELEDQ